MKRNGSSTPIATRHHDNRYEVSWHHIVSAVKHEMFPKMGTAMDAAIEGLENEEERKFNVMDLKEETVKMVIEGMKEKRKMTPSQITYIEGLVQRANAFNEQKNERKAENEDSSEPKISPSKWKG